MKYLYNLYIERNLVKRFIIVKHKINKNSTPQLPPNIHIYIIDSYVLCIYIIYAHYIYIYI